MKDFLKSITDLFLGVCRHPLKTLLFAFTAFSVLNTLATGITYFVPGIKFEGPVAFGTVIALSVGFALQKAWKPSKVEVPIANCNTVIEITFGDLFEQGGIRVIAVNDFFDSKIGKVVSDKSLHGIFLQKCFGGYPDTFDKEISDQLKNTPSKDIPAKIEGKTKSFPTGTTALISVNKDRYLLFVLSKTDPQTCKAQSEVTMMWDALHSLWQRARIESGGHEINLPLVGSGLSGLGLPTRDLLNLIILSAITETKANVISQRIRIVLHRERADDLDLRDVKKHWKE